MSQENVQLARELLALFNRRDKAAWLAVSDPDVENVPSREWPETEPVRGAEAVWSFWVVLTFRAGKLLRFEWFAERPEALRSAGLSE